ncbi:MAG: Na+/H+ antiporter NhaD-like permease [Desulfatitalea sp. BRH_c12]|nr:MAG: Na+/H+ antiporter NhaD-like permease [Desulfatitalea sp. BRH_c12]
MWAAFIFAVTYVGVAVGRIPWLLLDRTGIALLGAIAMVVSGAVAVDRAVGSIDVSTILLLYALMIISAQLRLGGFYTCIARRIAALCVYPRRFLLVCMGIGAFLSAILANDIICLAFTPVLAYSLLSARLNPMPFLLGLAVSSNIGSAATIIGNPQNMLIGQIGHLSFASFTAWCGPPALAALAGSYAIIVALYHRQWLRPYSVAPETPLPAWPSFNPWQSTKGLIAATCLVILFLFTAVPRELAAIGIAGLLLCSRKMRSRHITELIDWHLLTLFCALFVVIEGIAMVHLPEHIVAMLARNGIDLQHPIVLTGVATLLSNMVSNVPAAMLLVRFLDSAQPEQWYLLALSSTFAGNLITIGSIANLIVIEQARAYGIVIGFKTHAKVGLAVTAWSLLVVIGWIYL